MTDAAEHLADLKRLVTEAERETYSPLAKRCWFALHRWTMWDVRVRPGYYHMCEHFRRCVRCGKTQSRTIW